MLKPIASKLACATIAVLVGCTTPLTQAASLKLDTNPVAGSSQCSTATLTFTTAPPSGKTLNLATSLGILDVNADSDAAKRKLALTTTGALKQSVRLCPGTIAGEAELTAEAADLDIAPFPFEVEQAQVSSFYIDTERHELKADSATSTTLTVTLFGATPADSTPSKRVAIDACCDESKYAGCQDYLTGPPSVDTTALSPSQATGTLRLTADGESKSRSAKSGELVSQATLFAHANDAPKADCATLLGSTDTTIGRVVIDVVGADAESQGGSPP